MGSPISTKKPPNYGAGGLFASTSNYRPMAPGNPPPGNYQPMPMPGSIDPGGYTPFQANGSGGTLNQPLLNPAEYAPAPMPGSINQPNPAGYSPIGGAHGMGSVIDPNFVGTDTGSLEGLTPGGMGGSMPGGLNTTQPTPAPPLQTTMPTPGNPPAMNTVGLTPGTPPGMNTTGLTPGAFQPMPLGRTPPAFGQIAKLLSRRGD